MSLMQKHYAVSLNTDFYVWAENTEDAEEMALVYLQDHSREILDIREEPCSS